jgi:hypothetical protein
VRGSAPPEIVDLVDGRDLILIGGGERCQGNDHRSRAQWHSQSPIAPSVDLFPFYLSLSTAVHEITDTSMNDPSMTTAVPTTGSVSHRNGDRDSSIFFSSWAITAYCSVQSEIEFTRGVAELERRAEWRVQYGAVNMRNTTEGRK